MSITSEEWFPRLISNLRQVILNNEQLMIFINSVGVGKITGTGTYFQECRIKFRKTVTDTSPDQIFDNRVTSMTIRICEFSPRDINNVTLFHNERNSDTTSRYFYSNLYGRYWRDQLTAKQVGINVCKDVKLKGYMLNFNDMKTIISEVRRNTYEKLFDYVNEIFYVGDKNSLLGISANNGILYIRSQAMSKVLKENDDATVQKCLRNLLICFYQYYKKFTELNIRQYKDEAATLIEESVINRVVNGDSYSRRYYRSQAENETQTKAEFIGEIKDYIKSALDDMTNGSVFAIKDSYSYANIISNILNTRKDKEREIFNDGFASGMKLGMKLEMIGWTCVNPNFAEETDSTIMWWSKDVTIIPDSFMWGGERYSIPENKRKWKINKLYVSHRGRMRADGNHPNVSGNSVCMGDLSIDFTKSLSAIQETLKRAEELLDVINFDSAYRSEGRDDLLKVSTKIESLSANINKDEKLSAPRIREVDFDNDSDSSEEEVIVEPVPGETPVTLNDEPIAVMISNPEQEPDITNNGRRNRSREAEDEYLVANNIAASESIVNDAVTYAVTNEIQTLEDVRLVTPEGNRRPVVFFAGPANASNSIVTPPTTNIPDTHELALGDSNLEH